VLGAPVGLSALEYLAGVAELAAIAAALGYGAIVVRARLLPGWGGAIARLAELVLAIALLVTISQLLGLLGALEEWPLVIACVAVGIGGGALIARRWPRTLAPRIATGPAAPPLQLAVAVAVTAVLFAIWAIPTLESLGRGMYGFDTQWYHMPFAARFAETGEIWPFHYTSPTYLSWFYPANSELLHAAGILLFDRDLLSPLVNLGWLALALLAAWCLGRPWGVPGWSLLGAGVVLAGGVFADQPGDARNDAMALALILSSAALLANSREVRAGPALALAGAAAGLALGTRLTALIPVAALTAGAIALARRGERGRAAALWLLPLLALGGLWYLRNLVGAGNPAPWVDSLGPLSLPGPDQELGGREQFAVAHYATDTEVWGEWFAPGLRDALGLLWPGVLALAAAGAVAAIVRGPSPVVRVLGAVAIAGAVAYLFTPPTAAGPEGEPLGFESNLRYLTAPLALALALLPVALRGGRRSVAIAGLGAIGLVFAAAAADPDRWSEGYLVGALGAGIAAGAAIVLGSLGTRVRPWASAAGLAGLAAVAIGAGYPAQRQYLEQRYEDPAEVLPNPGLDTVFMWAREVEGSRIGTITTRQYPLYGTELSNHVQFVGLKRESAGFVRAADCAQWRDAVNAGEYDYLVVALDRAEEPGLRPTELGWTDGDPSARIVAEDGPATVFALEGRLEPGGCR
jgi:hypothetical protein